jgi:hypothetical protein
MNSPITGSVATNKFGTLTHTNGQLNVSPSQRSAMMQTGSGSVAFNLAAQQAGNDARWKAMQQQNNAMLRK